MFYFFYTKIFHFDHVFMMFVFISLFLFHYKCSVSSCLSNFALYVQTGDLSQLPLLCHYPVKVSQ